MCYDRFRVNFKISIIDDNYLKFVVQVSHFFNKFSFYVGSLTQSIRNFAKSLETWLSAAMVDCPREMTIIKVNFIEFHVSF